MTLRYSANLSMLWTDQTPLDRFDAAARAGFSHVEMLFPQALPVDDLEETLARNGLQMSLFDLFAGDWESGERGLAALPDRRQEFQSHWDEDLELAERLGTKTLTVLAGIRPEDADVEACDAVLIDNLRELGERGSALGITFTVEAINNLDVPGFHVHTVEHAARVVGEVGLGNVRVQFDQYHVSRQSQDPLEQLERHFGQIGHVQIADAPGRHEPGTGEAPIQRFLGMLEELGYRGRVGLEYIPKVDTESALSWLPRADRV